MRISLSSTNWHALRKGIATTATAVILSTVNSGSGGAQPPRIWPPVTLPSPTVNAGPASYFPPCFSNCIMGPGGGALTNTGIVNGKQVLIPGSPVHPQTQAGATAYGHSDWGYFPCVSLSCTPDGGVLSESEVGGAGYQSASTGFFGQAQGADGGSFQQYYAEAILQGMLGIPLLRALALSRETTGTAPGYSSDCCFYYNSQTIASTLQYYRFLGTVPETFTLQYMIDATLLAYHDPHVDYRPNASAAGGIFLHDGITTPELALELPLGSSIGGHQSFLNGSMADAAGYVTGSGSVTFTLQPGSGFYLSSYLSASAPPFPGFFVSDASHTMTANFTLGNTSLLVADVQGVAVPTAVVPEPATYALMACGLSVLAIVRRTRKSRFA